MQLFPNVVVAGLTAAVVGLIVFGVWLATRRRLAAQTVGSARDEAERLLRDAEREIGARRKEAELAAREQAQNLRHETENHARQRREELGRGRARPERPQAVRWRNAAPAWTARRATCGPGKMPSSSASTRPRARRRGAGSSSSRREPSCSVSPA